MKRIKKRLKATCGACGVSRTVPAPAELTRIRMRAGLSMRGCARRWGYSTTMIMKVESGACTCSTKLERLYLSLTRRPGSMPGLAVRKKPGPILPVAQP